MTISLPVILAVSACMFGLGLYGALTLNNAIRILMCIELVLNSVNINMIAFSKMISPDPTAAPDPAVGQVFTIFIMTVAAAEVAVGLAIVLMIARQRSHIDVDRINLLKW